MSTQRYRETVPCDEYSHDACGGEHVAEVIDHHTSCTTTIRTLLVTPSGEEREEMVMRLAWPTVDALRRLLAMR